MGFGLPYFANWFMLMIITVKALVVAMAVDMTVIAMP